MHKVSHLQLDYLLEIYYAEIVETNGISKPVTSADLALRMATSQSSVNRIVERLDSLELIKYERYVGMQLSEKGSELIHPVLRKQNIIESFLYNILQLEWHEVALEAKHLRHHTSNNVIERMWDMIGKPSVSPFGEPISTDLGTKNVEMILSNAEANQTYRIARVLTRLSDRLQYLSALGLIPDTEMRLIHKAPFSGPLQIQLDKEYRILGHELSQMITVVKNTSEPSDSA